VGARASYGGVAYHVLNRAAARRPIFLVDADYRAFEVLLEEARVRVGMRLIEFCLMPNHWHLVLWPERDGDLPLFMRWLTLTHAKRWHAAHGTTGTGALYQARYRFFAIEGDEHLWTVRRYVMRNPVRAGLVGSVADWRYGSASRRARGENADVMIDAGPLPLPADWIRRVDEPLTHAEREALARCLRRGVPFGRESWTMEMCERQFGTATPRPRGRPKKKTS
jgi:putative transposase